MEEKDRGESFHQSTPDIFRAIDLLRHKRNFIAHPNPVSVQVAEEKSQELPLERTRMNGSLS